MAFKATGFHDAVSYKIVHESGVVNAMHQNVTTSSGKLYSILAVNSGKNIAYLKIFDTPSATIASSQPIIILRIAAQSTEIYEIPGGLDFTNLSFCATQNQNPLDNTSAVTTLDVKLVCS
tara:strand:+ start:6179 stop:6538 length:360 start_codon:yes stop_codon:yes gene_type:complete